MAARSAFTLLELMVVMLIIATLAGLGAGGYRLARRGARENAALADLERVRVALEELRVEFGAYPQAEGEARTVFAKLSPERRSALSNSVPDLVLVDPWGRAYQYASTNRFQYRIWSSGPLEDDPSDDVDPAERGF